MKVVLLGIEHISIFSQRSKYDIENYNFLLLKKSSSFYHTIRINKTF